MPKIAVFDSGLGSLSVIKPIKKRLKAEIIYFADQDNFPYGTKSVQQLRKIIQDTIKKINENFLPDVIVVGSNTPSILLNIPTTPKLVGVYPPLKEAAKITKTKVIAVLVTRSVWKSKQLQNYIRKDVSSDIKVIKVNASKLVKLVESGEFISRKEYCKKRIRSTLRSIQKEKVDVVTLSSTHLPFLLSMLQESFPDIKFLDPADKIAKYLSDTFRKKKSKINKFNIYASGDTKAFQTKLRMIGIRNSVRSL